MSEQITKATFVRCCIGGVQPQFFNRLDSLTGAAKVFSLSGKSYRVGDKLSDSDVDTVAACSSNLVTVKGK